MQHPNEAQLSESPPTLPEDYVLRSGDWVSQLYDLCAHQHQWSMPMYQYAGSGGLGKWRVQCFCRVEVNKQPVDTFSCATTKKIAKQISSWRMVERLAKEHQADMVDATDESLVIEDYVGHLEDYCVSHSDLTIPRYKFTRQGPVHHLTHNCTCSIKTGKGILEYGASGKKKHLAMQSAAKMVLETLHAEYGEKPVAPPSSESAVKTEQTHQAIDVTVNFAAQLRAYCFKTEGFSLPRYELKRDMKGDSVSCLCRVITPHGEQIVVAAERTRNLACHVAAKKMIDVLGLATTSDHSTEDPLRQLTGICRRNGWPDPTLQFELWGDSHKRIFTCRISVHAVERSTDAISIGETKKIALRSAALELLRTISGPSIASPDGNRELPRKTSSTHENRSEEAP